MTLEIALLFLIILGMVGVMGLELLPTDTLAVTIMVVLIVGGFVSPAEGIAGLSNKAAVSVLALMILTVGLETTGVITDIGKKLKSILGGGEMRNLLIITIIVGSCSAFISSTAVVIVFMRIVIKLSKELPVKLSRLLIPLSFAGIMGGSCTLIGTSTNLLVSAIAEENELAPFGIFEFSHIGIVFFIAGIAYLVLVGRRLIPVKQEEKEDLTEEYALQDYLTEVIISENSRLVGKRVDQTLFFDDEEIDLIELKGKKERAHFPGEAETIQAGDILLIKANVEKLAQLRRVNDLSMVSRQSIKDEKRLNTEEMTLCEIIVKPNSRLLGQTLKKTFIKRDYDAIPLAVKKNRKYYQSGLDELTIEAGDTVLMEVGRANFKQFYNLPEFVVLQEHEDLAYKSNKRYLAAGILIGVILLAALNIMPILVSALAGCVAMFLTGCLDLQKSYRRVDWNVYFLLAGVIPLGTAMDNTGASQLIADVFTHGFGNVSPGMLVAMIYLATTLLSAVISNNATAILFAPIAISIATNLELDPRPLLLTVMFAANMSFISPLGYQTNTLVYSAGQYKVMDFFRVGGGLSLIIWLLAIWLIPLFYF